VVKCFRLALQMLVEVVVHDVNCKVSGCVISERDTTSGGSCRRAMANALVMRNSNRVKIYTVMLLRKDSSYQQCELRGALSK